MCSAGSYTGAVGLTNCTNCPIGKYQLESGGSRCIDCAVGRFAPEVKSPECTDCGVGRYQDTQGQATCIDCPPGRFQRAGGMYQCIDCDAGMWQALEGQGYCENCAKGYWSLPGSPYCEICDVGYWFRGFYQFMSEQEPSDDIPEEERPGCVLCPKEAQCAGNLCVPKPKAGYWSDRNTNDPDDAGLNLYKCPTLTCAGTPDVVVDFNCSEALQIPTWGERALAAGIITGTTADDLVDNNDLLDRRRLEDGTRDSSSSSDSSSSDGFGTEAELGSVIHVNGRELEVTEKVHTLARTYSLSPTKLARILAPMRVPTEPRPMKSNDARLHGAVNPNSPEAAVASAQYALAAERAHAQATQSAARLAHRAALKAAGVPGGGLPLDSRVMETTNQVIRGVARKLPTGSLQRALGVTLPPVVHRPFFASTVATSNGTATIPVNNASNSTDTVIVVAPAKKSGNSSFGGDLLCLEGSEGPMCGTCSEGYFLSSSVCAPCGGGSYLNTFLTLAILGVLAGAFKALVVNNGAPTPRCHACAFSDCLARFYFWGGFLFFIYCKVESAFHAILFECSLTSNPLFTTPPMICVVQWSLHITLKKQGLGGKVPLPYADSSAVRDGVPKD